MLKKAFRNKSLKSIGALLSASTLVTGMGLSQPVQAADPFLAEIIMFAGNFNPRGWAYCNGQLLAISSNSALFSLLGTTYGGDGRTTFALPDLRGRVAVHSGGNSAGPGLPAVRLGERGGAITATLNVSNLPAHSHTATLRATDANGNITVPYHGTDARMERSILASKSPSTKIYHDNPPSVTMDAMHSSSIVVSNTGANVPFSIRNPYLGINFIIATVGTFPSRN